MFKFFFREAFPVTADELLRRTLYDFSEYEKFSPDVNHVEELSRVTQPDGREIITIRVFARPVFPQALRPFFRMSEMSWKERYIVDLKSKVVDWEVETPEFMEYIQCSGTSWCADLDGGSEMVITGKMIIEPPRIAGLSPAVVRRLIRILEPFIGNVVSYNLKKYFKSVRECMEKEAAIAARKAS